ncbi:penicillin acylase family protein [Streptomyces sp. SCSIO 30461]|uniref:penicillin acylase family protein n=1 Tax=Streptomyces sp. SCSIO 30461 TaxID=3118085 RepID=UPI0030D414A8
MRTEVFRDAWGIPHLRAGSVNELAYAQGHNAAVDRAWQLEIERHRAQGTSAAILGSDALAWDTFARQARLADTARRCYEALGGEPRAWVAAYVDGVNAGLRQGAAAAPEFAEAGITPGTWEAWTPLSLWLSTHVLFAGFPTKLWRDEVARRLGDEATELFAVDGPGTAGSNGWLVSAGRTGTGAPLIAGDPHRFIEDPGIYQQVHLVCPDYDVTGLAFPGVPGVAHFAHTGGVAWAITNAMADYQDLYRERLRRTADGVEALGPDGWHPASRHTETIEVAGGDPVRVEVIETARGPVIIGAGPQGDETVEAISLRYVPRVTGELGFTAIAELLKARTVADVDRAFERWVEPVNVVLAADTSGGLLHRTAGRVPLRHKDNRLRVVPAWEHGHEWQGMHDPMPRADVADFAVMANERALAGPLGVEFAPRHRADRITELLRASDRWSAAEMASVHMDTRLASARPLLDLIDGLDGLGPAAGVLRERLRAWDLRMDAESTDAAAYAEVRHAVVRRFAGHPALASLSEPLPYPAVFQPWLNLLVKVGYALEVLLTTELLPGIDRAELVRAALEEVAADPTRTQATWGERHQIAPWQALPLSDEQWPGTAGDHDCVLATSSVPGLTDRAARGPAARYVWDLRRREDSRWVVPLGARGVPGDPHHRDQLPLWLRGELVPVVTDFAQLSPDSADGTAV